MTGEEIDISQLESMTDAEWLRVTERQAQRIADLTAQLKARERAIEHLRAEQDAALYRQGVGL